MEKLTEEQSKFIEIDGNVVLCACPGSGKTYIIGKKVLKYLKCWNLKYSGVAILSFTNVASKEIQRQIEELDEAKLYDLNFPHFNGTIDSFINTFIFLRFGYLMYKEVVQRPKIIHDNIGEINFPYSECYKKQCAKNINWFKWSGDQLLRNGNIINCNIINKPCIAYKKQMFKNGYVTQDEVPTLALRILKKYPQIAIEIAYRFPIIIIDEAQDTSREQLEIFEIIADCGINSVIFVGDPDQAIYEWRDATPMYFYAKINDKNWHPLFLTANFRSSQKICDATIKFSSHLMNKSIKSLAKYADFGIKPVLLQVNQDKSKEDIVDWFKHFCIKNGVDPESKDVAILTRSRINSESDITDLWKTSETKYFAYATYLWHSGLRKDAFVQCEMGLFNLMIGDSNGLTKVDIIFEVNKKLDYKLWKHLVIQVLTLLPNSEIAIKTWRINLIKILDDLVRRDIIFCTQNRKMQDIIKLKSRIKIDEKYSTEFLEKSIRYYFEKKSSNGTIYSTVHGVKGESYDAILLLINKLKGNTLTSSKLLNGSLDSEQIRIAYVAMTRPRKLLVVSIPKLSGKNDLTRFPNELWDYIEI